MVSCYLPKFDRVCLFVCPSVCLFVSTVISQNLKNESANHHQTWSQASTSPWFLQVHFDIRYGKTLRNWPPKSTFDVDEVAVNVTAWRQSRMNTRDGYIFSLLVKKQVHAILLISKQVKHQYNLQYFSYHYHHYNEHYISKLWQVRNLRLPFHTFVCLFAPKLYQSIVSTNCLYYSIRVDLFSNQVLLVWNSNEWYIL